MCVPSPTRRPNDFGIAVVPPARFDVHPNAIFANWQMAIDIGLNGPSDYPTITNAFYDPASDTTTIDITYNDNSTFAPTLQFYAADARHSSGHGDAQYYLGGASPRRTNFSSSTSSYSFVRAGDFRGKWVSATITHNSYYGFLSAAPLSEGYLTNSTTSELSNAVQLH